ncbi:hypothetical protein RN001_004680 [Aquatica leii]|uniref:CREG-like beta-barrel domain-containing protein n=1 Tax=Aquatica leii TaxID=1421715 RepID=A0AAN7PIP9_9COLE|nr:hypothetical protein RN001_004680 [Aquatica leii]
MYYIKLIFFTFTLTAIVNGLSIIEVNPPNPEQAALMARYIIHNVGWVVVSSISVMPEIPSYPYNTILEMCDGNNEKGNGIPYLYVTIFDPFHTNTLENNKCTLLATLATTDWCKEQQYEEEDPRCARVMLSGRFVKMDNSTEEYQSALNNMHRRHPKTKYWPEAHHWYVAKIDIDLVTLFDAFGGLKTIDVKEYLKANEYEHLNEIYSNPIY